MDTYTRVLSDNELSYFLPSRQDGVNDMAINVAFNAPPTVVTSLRVAVVWAFLRLQHPLLASQVKMEPGAYDNASFSYTPPSSPSQAILEAKANLSMLSNTTADDLMDDFINGPRRVSAEHMCHMYIIQRPDETTAIRSYNMLMFLPHFLSDAQAVHQICNVFFTLLGGLASPGGPMRGDIQLMQMLEAEWTKRWATAGVQHDAIPAPAEARLPSPRTKFQQAVATVDFQASQARLIGGHVFPRVRTQARKIMTIDVIFDSTKTKAILTKCKSENVTVSNALFVICNFAWIRNMRSAVAARPGLSADKQLEALPIMIYTALSLRPYLTTNLPSSPPIPPSYFFLAITYFNIVLPSFMPSTSTPSSVFWHRARQVKSQNRKYISSPMFTSRTQNMSKERAKRAKIFAREDDAATLAHDTASKAVPSLAPRWPAAAPPVPSVALLGLSHLGNLDDFYPPSYPLITLTHILSHTRRGKGGMLMFSQTFRGKLYLMFEWDQAAFKEDVVERFWRGVEEGMEEFLVNGTGVGTKL